VKDKDTLTVKEANRNHKALLNIRELVWSILRVVRAARKSDQNFISNKVTDAILQDLLSSLENDIRQNQKELLKAKQRFTPE